jgi:branched-chain amino acid transport system ATP-binding protein
VKSQTVPAAGSDASLSAPVLETRGLTAGYGPVPVIRDVNLLVAKGEMIGLFGANGVGKTTTIMTLAGHLRSSAGSVLWHGRGLSGPPHLRARNGMALVTQERCVFMTLSVQDNLRLGLGSGDEVLDLFPELRPHAKKTVGLLSGGQQQMLAIGRAIASKPDLLIADEPSLGLAPKLVDRVLAVLRRAVDEYGVSVLIVEQQVPKALRVVDRGYVLRRGAIALQGTADELAGQMDDLHRSYVAGTGEM